MQRTRPSRAKASSTATAMKFLLIQASPEISVKMGLIEIIRVPAGSIRSAIYIAKLLVAVHSP